MITQRITSVLFGMLTRISIFAAISCVSLLGCSGSGLGAREEAMVKVPNNEPIITFEGAARTRRALASVGVVSGPVIGGSYGFPFGAPSVSVDFSLAGYVQEEYFLEGTATSFTQVGTWTTDGAWTAAPAGTAAYKTRLLVARPTDPTQFNGTVVVEWLNETAGWDIADDFIYENEELLRSGYAWVGVSAQALGVQLSPFALKAWDPARYASLNHPGDAYAYDIFSQVAQAIRSPQGVNPLPGLTVAHILADGHSQSANGLTTYVNAIHPLAEQYDGFLLHGRGVSGLPLDPDAGGAVPSAAIIRTDTTAPVLSLEDEWSVAVAFAWVVRQPDGPMFRLWEVAGTGHVDAYENSLVGPIVGHDLGFPPLVCAEPLNEAPHRYLANSAVDRLNAWVTNGSPPPHAPAFIQIVNAGVVRDAYGNAKGGIRLPQLEVPTATLTGPGNSGPGSCPVGGVTAPFDAATLHMLYPRHGSYVRRFVHATNDLQRAGFLLPPDAEDAKNRAAQSAVGH